MDSKKCYLALVLFLTIVLCANLASVQRVHADGENPTEPPAPTQAETELPTEPAVAETALPTESPVVATDSPTESAIVETSIPEESSAVPEEVEETPVAEVLSQVPENTDVVVLDQNGDSVPLVTQEAAEIMDVTDPIWCPAGVLPGGPGCSNSYGTINELITDMRTHPSSYQQDGVIYFTSSAGSSLVLTNQTSSLGSAFETLNDFNLTLQGGWNGSTSSPSLSGQTDFAATYIKVGTTNNPWAGNVTLNDLVFSSGSGTSVLVYTTNGDITLNNVDVTEQLSGTTATLVSTSGDITVQNSTFDGGSTDLSSGFSATTGGSINISDTSFTDGGTNPNNGTGYHGATLSAPIVTLTNVTATGNNGDGIIVTNTNVVTLNNVNASENGTEKGTDGLSGNDGSGVFVNGTVGSRLIIIGGTFVNNQEYGVQVSNRANTTIYIQSDPVCTGNDSNAAPTNSCYNRATTIFDNTAPVITPSVSGGTEVNGWYSGDVTVSWSIADAESGILSSDCPAVTLDANTTGTALTCSATNNAGLSNSASVTIKIDKSVPIIVPVVSGATEVNGWYGGDVSADWSVTDGESGILSSSGCTVTNLTTETTGTALTCSATNNAGLSNSASITIKIDKTGPVISGSNVTTEATGSAGAAASYSVSAVDAVDGPVSVNCSPISGSMFPVGVNTVACSASDLRGNTSNASLLVTVNDSTAPNIEYLADIMASTRHRFGKQVFYPSPATSDLVDGAGVAACSPASGSYFPIGNTRVTCSVTDAHGNSATSTFIIHIEYEPIRPTPAPSRSSTIIVPKTNDDLINLDTESVFWAFGIRFSFINLGDQQAAIHEVTGKDLPAKLPDGFSLVVGVNVDVLTDGKLLKELPKGSSLKMDFPMAGEANNQFAVLYWNGSEWVKLAEQNGGGQLPRILSVTTNKTGIFVLVKK